MPFFFTNTNTNKIKIKTKFHNRFFRRLPNIYNILNININILALLLLLLLVSLECHTIESSLYMSQPTSPGVYMVRSPESIIAPKGDEVLFECELNLEFERLEWRFRHYTWKSNEFHNLTKNVCHTVDYNFFFYILIIFSVFLILIF